MQNKSGKFEGKKEITFTLREVFRTYHEINIVRLRSQRKNLRKLEKENTTYWIVQRMEQLRQSP